MFLRIPICSDVNFEASRIVFAIARTFAIQVDFCCVKNNLSREPPHEFDESPSREFDELPPLCELHLRRRMLEFAHASLVRDARFRLLAAGDEWIQLV